MKSLAGAEQIVDGARSWVTKYRLLVLQHAVRGVQK
jgi:hypothetical protein